MPLWDTGVQYGTRAGQPTPNAKQSGTLYFVSDEDIIERWNGTAWQQVATNGAGGDADWTTPSLDNSWVAYTTGSDAKYRKLSSGLVVLKGEVKSGSVGASVFTLPSGYRPAYRHVYPARATFAADTYKEVIVGADGTVVPQAGASNAYIVLSTVFYEDGS